MTKIREDRGAIEYACITDFSKKLWNNKYHALTIGETILWESEESMKNKKFLNHEICHVKQQKKYGPLKFKILYLFEQLVKGYDKNKFELEAQKSERL